MKLRPAMQLRFRDAEQFERIKASAAKSEISVNEYILCAIEYAESATKKKDTVAAGIYYDKDGWSPPS